MTIANAKPDLLITGPLGTSMVNGASSLWSAFTGVEPKLTAAIAYAASVGAKGCYVPDCFLPYNASLVTFNTAVKMFREGGRFDVWDVEAYGAAGDGATNDAVAINAAIAGAVAAPGGVVFFPRPKTYFCGTSSVNVLGKGVTLKGVSQRDCILAYTGSTYFLNLGTNIHGSNWAGVLYDGVVSQTLIEDLVLHGPGVGVAGAVGIVDWGAGSNNFTRLQLDNWDKAYFGIQADVCTWTDIYASTCNTVWHLASRCDQQTFIDCYPTSSQIGWLIEYANGVRWFGGQCVFNTVADIIFDCPAAGTLSGDIRGGYQAGIYGVWFESAAGGMPRHIWVGRNGAAGRLAQGIEVYGPRLQSANTTNFMDVDAGDNITINDIWMAGTITGNCVNINAVASVFPTVKINNPRMNPFNNIIAGAGSLANVEVQLATRRVANTAFANPYTPSGTEAETIYFVLTGNTTINAPTIHLPGRKMRFHFIQDGTGGRTIALFFIQGSTYSNAGNIASAHCTLDIYWDGFNWVQAGCSGWNGIFTGAVMVGNPVKVITFNAALPVNALDGNAQVVTLTGATVVGAPTNPQNGQRLAITFIQDGTGGRAVTWNAVFKVTWADTGNTLNKRSTIAFIYDGTSWNQDGAQTPYV